MGAGTRRSVGCTLSSLRCGRIAARVLLGTGALAVAEFIGLVFAFSVGIVLVPFAPVLLLAGLVAGVVGLVVGAVRRRAGAPAGGIGGFDLLLHAVLLANTVLIAVLLLVRGLGGSGLGDLLLGGMVVAGSLALVGMPCSVGTTWARAFTPRSGAPARPQDWVLRVAHTANVALAAAVVVSSAGSVPTLLLGSLSR
ncbi:MAG: hypothetical protein HIU86_12530 [Acidobacteria bacterium]|nr:hypothetical protein [Acidobacteriota bacterium]